MNETYPDTYCGIYCGACSILMHGETSHADGFAACLGSVPKEEIACGGCKSDNRYAGCRICNIRDCALKKGIEHCINCDNYPCKMYSKWQSAAKFLPHIRETASSLEAIKSNGVDSCLAAQKKRWSCPDCGTPFSWYALECNKCGRRFASEAHDISGWRKFLCRFVLPIVYRKGAVKGAN